MPEVVDKISIRVTLKPKQYKTVLGLKIRNISNRAKQLDITITNLDIDKRVANTFKRDHDRKIKDEKDKE